ncbi:MULTISPECIES: OpgC family protein [unclassified Pseudomonas]|uniref:OpgC family protein n=1 Tax=unclassified Pseudomonas TaxID=196821 RepID=UPI000C86CD37|nr:MULTISPECIES: OpgC domain-containing protein [unclassified Pseudomonas]PMV85332.1 OpgC domain-containing protein [Pseudomonas sp. GW101-1A09]PMV91690.1 OpgC domain-containing protein [Pseudomonas sp. FW306-2-2C-B10A]PMV93439.1 OpgC domain-containing protein [Pseudomonas sp. GW460-C8]PMW05567.1 OpgC domain-containing protein [Pseudomonas sp. MPR-TSA4]PMW15216.1 OpgC domain-containing protein [Pseudomonas sp. GW456-11-11-14-TSB2]
MTTERDHRIDFFRGLALIFIFWDHVPHNPLGQITLRNVGFSDAAEVFVFLAGYAAVLAYGKILARDGYLIACVKILRRAWVLYVVHIFLLAMLMGIVFFANSHVETRDLVEEMGMHHFISNPQQALIDELLLRFKPNLMDPLPLYIVLLAGLPLVLPIFVRKPWVVVAMSFAVYLTVPLFGWNLAAIKDGVWYFNPVAWQLLFVLGGAAAIHTQRPRLPDRRPLLRQPLFVSAALYAGVAGVLTVLWRWPQLHDAMVPTSLSNLLYPISKTDLSPVRLLHFLALAYVTAKLLPDTGWTQNWLARQCSRMGRYSLEVFCLGVLLAPLADMINALTDDAFAMQIFTALVGAGLMGLLGVWLDFNKRLTAPIQPVAVR